MKKTIETIQMLLYESRNIVNTNPDLAREKADEAYRLSEGFKYFDGLFESLFIMGRISNMFNNCQEAIQYYENCIKTAVKLGDIKKRTLAINASGVSYFNMSVHSKALECFLEALELAKMHKHPDVESRILTNISLIFSDLKDYQTALEYLFEAQRIISDTECPIGACYHSIANIYHNLKEYEKCYQYCLMARNAVWREKDAEHHGDVYYIMASVFYNRMKFRKAFRYYHAGLRLAERNHRFLSQAEGCRELAVIFFEQKEYDVSLTYIKRALEICCRLEYHGLQRSLYKLFADVCHAMGNPAGEIEALRQYTEVSCMLEDKDTDKKRIYAQMQIAMFNMKKEHEHLKSQVLKDAMTGCLSYRDYESILQKELRELAGMAAVFFVDIDNLKYINDKYGHDAGDQLIKEFAATIRDMIKGKGLIFRKGGDEFIIYLPFFREEELYSFNEELYYRLSKARIIGKTLASISCSMGISIAPKDSSDPKELENMADKAMYQAKKLGKRCYCFYDASAIK